MREFGDAILACLRARAVWEPGETVLPGDFGVLMGGCFVKRGSVVDFGVELKPSDTTLDSNYVFSRSLNRNEGVEARASVEWTASAISSMNWGGKAGLFIGAPRSELLTIPDLRRVVVATLKSGQWGLGAFNWRLVRQVRVLENGVVMLASDQTRAGRVQIASEVPLQEGSASMNTQTALGFSYFRENVSGAAYAHCIRLRPFLTHGAAPPDEELWFEDLHEDD